MVRWAACRGRSAEAKSRGCGSRRLLAVWMGTGLMLGVLAVGLVGCAITVGQVSTTGTGTTIPLTIVRGSDHSTLATVPVTINGKGPYAFVLDTGASISLVDASVARQLNLPRSGGRQPVSGVGGTELVAFVVVTTWKAGSVALPRSTIGSGSLPSGQADNRVSGLLGSDIWSQFGKISVDYDLGVLTVYQRTGANGGTPVGAVRGCSLAVSDARDVSHNRYSLGPGAS
jgi:aspartyl protease